MKWIKRLFVFIGIFLLALYYVMHYQSSFSVVFDAKLIESFPETSGELFYSDGDDYSAAKRKVFRYKNIKNKYQEIEIHIQNMSNISSLRLDPLPGKGTVEIKNFTLIHQDKIYPINFLKIKNDTMHNIKILIQNENRLMLQCTGPDPYLELSDTLQVNKMTIYNIILSILITFGASVLFILMVKLIKRFTLENIILFGIIVIYTWQTILSSNWAISQNLIVVFAIISIFVALYINPLYRIGYIKNIGIFLIIYILMGYISFHITTELADREYYYRAVPYIILASVIPLVYYNINQFNMRFFKVALTVLVIVIAVFILLVNYDILSSNSFIYDYLQYRRMWMQKNYMFMYMLLTFGTISFYNIKNKIDLLSVVALLVLVCFTVFSDYSDSAKLSFIVGLFIYILFSLFSIKKKYLLAMIWIFTLYVIFSPILLSLLDLGAYLPKLNHRDAIYNTSTALIKEHWFFGYGYGSTLHVHLKDFVDAVDIPEHYHNTYPGGHPHNLSLLFWLEFGIFGAIFLAYFIHRMLAYVIENTYNRINQAGILAMIVCFEIITAFSWSIWYPHVLLTFAFFGIMLVLSMNIKIKRDQGN